MKYREPSDFYLQGQFGLKHFKIVKKKGGELPAIITIDGFLNEDLNETLEWKKAILLKYPKNAWYHLRWESKSQKELLVNSLNSIISPYMYGIGKTWKTAKKNSEKSGELLSKILINSEVNQYILIGHSLGARVIFNCLKSLENRKIIYEVHLLGGAVSNTKRKWILAERCIINVCFNYISMNDSILKTLYKISTLDLTPIGRNIIESNKAKNIDVTKLVSGHIKFKEKFSSFIK